MTDNAGYCMAVTAKRNGMRLLAIVLGEKEGKVRNSETAKLLDYGFNTYEVTTIKNKGDIVGEITFDKANPEKIDVMLKEDVIILHKKGEQAKEYNSEVKLVDITLPLKSGEVIGKLLVKDNGKTIQEASLVSSSNMEKRGFFDLWFSIFKSIVTGYLIG